MTRTVSWFALASFATALAAGLLHCVGEQPDFPEADASSPPVDGTAPKDAPATPDAREAAADAPTDDGPNGDDAANDTSAPDAGDPIRDASPSPCDLSKPFGNLTNVSELNGTTDDESARLTADQLAVYFSRRSGPAPSAGGFNVFFATRVALDASFNGLTKLSLGIDPSGPSVTGDHQLLYYATGDGDGAPNILVSTPPFDYTSSEGLANVNTAAWEFTPYVRPDNLELYFASNRSGVRDDLYVSPRVNGEFAAPVPITLANTDAGERAPVITNDNLTLYFASNRAGSYDIYSVQRKTVADGFGYPLPVTELNTPSHEFPDWISPDGCTIYFRTDRPDGGKGGRDIWRATKP
jgi:hypothetical protein